MRLALMLVLLAGCSTTAPAAAPATDPASESAPVEGPEVQVLEGTTTVQVGAGGPLGHQASEGGTGIVTLDEVPHAVLLELVWQEGAVYRSPMLLRVIDAQDRYLYASGSAGTPDDPVRLLVEDPIVGTWSVAALPDDSVVVEQAYTVFISIFDAPMPEGYTAVA